jgi:alkanesulfonate monooxygenase SsuD/methylene tetrahydromethanopterin reductase-like flavin-dependent oxidoreductase (luciferase family)
MPATYASRYPHGAVGKPIAGSYDQQEGGPPFPPDTVWAHATVALSFVAAVTERVKLSTCVIPMLTRDPLSLAKESATLDRLSEGRFELGLGAGWLKEEAELLGHPSDRPTERLAEAVEIMQLAWSQPSFEFSGRFWHYDEVHVNPKPVRGTIPIWIGGGSTPALRVTKERAVGNIAVGGAEGVKAMRERLDELDAASVRIAVATNLVDGVQDAVHALRAAGADVVIVRTHGEPTAENVASNIERMRSVAEQHRATVLAE